MSGRERWRRAVPGGALALGLLLGGAGCDGRSAADDAGWRAVLAARAAAVTHRDRAAFLATVDPRVPGLRAAQAGVFDDLRRLPLASFSYRVVGTGAFPVGAPDEVAVDARLSYALRGYDTAPVTSEAYLTMSRRAGHWYLSSQTDGDSVGKRTAPQPWDLGPLTVVTGRRSLVIGQGTATALRTYADLADRAVPVVSGAWPGRWADRAIIEVPGTEAEMAALIGAPAAAYQDIAAVTTAELRGTGSAPADRVIVNPQAFAGLSAFGRRVVLTHELTHVATRSATTSHTPLWLSEGFADWVGYTGSGRTPAAIAPELRGDVAAGHPPAALPTDADFATTDPRLAQAYEGGWLACRMIAADWGPAKLTAFYAAAGRTGPAPALRTVLGLTEAAFTARWRAYLTEELS